jgi:MYXO-CTERM domain-containing protein
VSFDRVVSDPDGTIASAEVTLADGTVLSGATPQHAFAEPGRYPVTLTVTDDSGLVARDTLEVIVTGADGQLPPRIVSSGALIAKVGEPYSYDADRRIDAMADGPVVFGVADDNTASGAQVDPATGEVTWIPQLPGRVRLVVFAAHEGSTATTRQYVELEVLPGDLRSYAIGSGCAGAPGPSSAWALIGLVGLAVRRRRSRAPRS